MAGTAELNPRPRVLVVNDEPGMRKYLQTLLEVESYQVETADSGEQAIAYLERGAQSDLVLLDMMMPGIDRSANHRTIAEDSARPQNHHAFLCQRHTQSGASNSTGRLRLCA